MRVQKVNDSTIRIFISLTELADRDISMADLFQRSPKTEQLFWELIAQAREEVEFSLDQPFWIQATVASNDEFVITVIKQDEQGGEVPPKEKDRKKSPRNNRVLEWVYVFEDFENLLASVARLPQFAQLRSSVYQFEDEYYLTLRRLGVGKKRQLAEALLDEYGERVSTTEDFLVEHGKTITCGRAVETLRTSFRLDR